MNAKQHARKMLVKRNHPLLHADPVKPEKAKGRKPAEIEEEKSEVVSAENIEPVAEQEPVVAKKKKATKKGTDDTVD